MNPNPNQKNYCTKTNLPCYVNAQRWYYVRALNNYKKAKNQNYKNRQKAIIQYYTSGHYYF
jgi:hypothetical protein